MCHMWHVIYHIWYMRRQRTQHRSCPRWHDPKNDWKPVKRTPPQKKIKNPLFCNFVNFFSAKSILRKDVLFSFLCVLFQEKTVPVSLCWDFKEGTHTAPALPPLNLKTRCVSNCPVQENYRGPFEHIWKHTVEKSATSKKWPTLRQFQDRVSK